MLCYNIICISLYIYIVYNIYIYIHNIERERVCYINIRHDHASLVHEARSMVGASEIARAGATTANISKGRPQRLHYSGQGALQHITRSTRTRSHANTSMIHSRF